MVAKACTNTSNQPGCTNDQEQKHAAKPAAKTTEAASDEELSDSIDRTVKQYIGGKQARPDSGYSFPVYASDGKLIGEAPLGNRKDIRNAVEAAHKAEKWAKTAAHTRAQILYYIAENLIQRRAEITTRLAQVVGEQQAAVEVEATIDRIFTYAGMGRQVRRRPSTTHPCATSPSP